MPGTLAGASVRSARSGRRSALRSLIGLRSIVICPWLAAASVPTDDVPRDVRVLGHDGGDFLLVRDQARRTTRLRRPRSSRCSWPVSSVGKRPLGIDVEQPPVATRMTTENTERREPVVHDPGEAALVRLSHASNAALGQRCTAARARRRGRTAGSGCTASASASATRSPTRGSTRRSSPRTRGTASR